MAEHQDQIQQPTQGHLRQLENGFRHYQNLKREDIRLEGFHSMSRVEDVKVAKVMVL